MGAVSLHTWTGGRSGTIIRTSGGEQSESPGVTEPPLSMCVLLSREKKFPQPPCKSFFCRLERSFHFSRAVTQSLLLKLHSFVSLSREFSKYIKTFAAGCTLVQTVLHDVFAGVQSETIWFKTENVSEVKMEVCVRNSQKYRGKRSKFPV